MNRPIIAGQRCSYPSPSVKCHTRRGSDNTIESSPRGRCRPRHWRIQQVGTIASSPFKPVEMNRFSAGSGVPAWIDYSPQVKWRKAIVANLLDPPLPENRESPEMSVPLRHVWRRRWVTPKSAIFKWTAKKLTGMGVLRTEVPRLFGEQQGIRVLVTVCVQECCGEAPWMEVITLTVWWRLEEEALPAVEKHRMRPPLQCCFSLRKCQFPGELENIFHLLFQQFLFAKKFEGLGG